MMTELVDFGTLAGSFEKAASAPTTPTETTKFQHQNLPSYKSRNGGRRVTFPIDDLIVTGYLEPADPWSKALENSTDVVLDAYQVACEKQNIRPLPKIFKQLQSVKSFTTREKELSLKGQKLDYKHVEAMEEVFKRIQFEKIDLEGCSLDEEGAAALFDMIEYYESATFLNISFHKNIDSRGWQACSRMLKKTPCLKYLEIRNTNINEQMLLILGRALRIGSNLVSLNFENCGLTGRSIVVLVAAIKLNSTLKELYLGDNKISSSDGIQLGNLLRTNTWLEILDLHANHLQDTGLIQVIDGLKEQPDGPGDGLLSLNLSNNHITHHGMLYLGKAMLNFRSLSNMDIGNNNIADDGIHHLKQGLMTSQTLNNLGLQNAKITCEGAVALAEYLADSKVVQLVNLKENSIKVAGLMALSISMKHNDSVVSLELDPVSIKDFSALEAFEEHKNLLSEISEFCQRNKKDQVHKKNGLSPDPLGSPKLQSEKMLFKSASTPASRFKVSKVVLEKGSSEGMFDSSIKILSSSAPAEMTPSHIQKSLETLRNQLANLNGIQQQKLKTPKTTFAGSEPATPNVSEEDQNDYLLGATSSLVAKEKDNDYSALSSILKESRENEPLVSVLKNSRPFLVEDDDDDDTKTKNSRRLMFVLPEQPASPRIMGKNRRMSTPAMPIAASLRRPHHLKLCKQLESLDLRSSVPLSPTRLYEGWVFPDPPIEFKLPPEEANDEPSWNCSNSPAHCA